MPEISKEEYRLYLKFQKEHEYHVPREVENIVIYRPDYFFQYARVAKLHWNVTIKHFVTDADKN